MRMRSPSLTLTGLAAALLLATALPTVGDGPRVARAAGATPVQDADAAALSPFAENVLLHVVLHELGHALVREFDLPVLGNEETLADAFATHYLTTHMPERALAVLEARVTSLMIEADEVPREAWPVTGEHNNDARRAHQIAALALAANHERYAPLAEQLGLSERDVRRARDYGSEIHRSWRRILGPLWMPEGTPSAEARMTYDPGCRLAAQVRDGRLGRELEAILRRFDWHSTVTVSFIQGDGGAAWSRSERAVRVRSAYIERFVEQGRLAGG